MINWVDDGWFGWDKFWHFALHFGIVLTYGFILPWLAFGRTHWLMIVAACVISETWGGLYELYDSARGVGASIKDLVWNNIGMVTAIIAGSLI